MKLRTIVLIYAPINLAAAYRAWRYYRNHPQG